MANPRIPARRGHKHKLFRDFDSLRLDDNQALQFGDDADATLYFDGTSLIINGPAKFLDDQTLTFGTDDDAVIHWDSSEGELDIALTGGRIDLNADIRFTTAKGINAETASGLCNLDLDSLVNDNSDSYIRVNRSTSTTGSAYMQWFKGDGTAGVGMEFEHDNSTDSSYLSLKGDGDVTLTLSADENNSGEGNNPWIKFDQDGGAVGSMIGHAGSGAVKPDGTTFTGGGSNDLIIAQDGDGVNINLGGSDGVVLKVVCSDDVSHGIRIYDNDHSTYAAMYHANTTLDFTIKSDASSPIHILQQAQGGIWHDVQQVADEATGTFNLPADGGFFIIVASTTSDAETGQECQLVYLSGTTAITINTPANWSVGSGSNPDTSPHHNVWRSADSTLSIKNRRGSTRYYAVYGFMGL
jgi:hypothetical protein